MQWFTSYIPMLGASSWLWDSIFLRIYTLGGSEWWSKEVGPCHKCGRLRLSPSCCGHLRHVPADGSLISPSVSPCLSFLKRVDTWQVMIHPQRQQNTNQLHEAQKVQNPPPLLNKLFKVLISPLRAESKHELQERGKTQRKYFWVQKPSKSKTLFKSSA